MALSIGWRPLLSAWAIVSLIGIVLLSIVAVEPLLPQSSPTLDGVIIPRHDSSLPNFFSDERVAGQR